MSIAGSLIRTHVATDQKGLTAGEAHVSLLEVDSAVTDCLDFGAQAVQSRPFPSRGCGKRGAPFGWSRGPGGHHSLHHLAERLHQLRIELMSLSSFNNLERPIGADGWAISPRHGQYIVNLSDVDQPRQKWDVFSRQTIRIARSIPAFVMVANCGHDVIEAGADQNPLSDHRVFLVADAVVGGWRTRAIQALVIEFAHSDIVEKSGKCRFFGSRWAKFKLFGHRESEA